MAAANKLSARDARKLIKAARFVRARRGVRVPSGADVRARPRQPLTAPANQQQVSGGNAPSPPPLDPPRMMLVADATPWFSGPAQ